jgi:uncharacterized protein
MLTNPDQAWWSTLDTIISTIVLFFVNGKFLGLLAIMFGVGLQLKYQQALRKGDPWPGMYIWISIILMAEGFFHFLLVMEYDILMSYAITAIIVSFIVKRGDKAIKRAMIVFGSIHVLIYFGILVLQFLGAQVNGGDQTAVIALYRDGTWLEQVAYRWQNFLVLRMELMLAFGSNIFLFLTGVMLMRKGAFAADEQGRNIRRNMLTYGLLFGIPLNLLLFIPGGYFDMVVRYVFAPVLSLGYIGLIAYTVEKYRSWVVWNWFERIGKMALSSYVLQNIVCSIVFYGWGLALGGKVNSMTIVLIWLLVSVLQVLFTTIWLRYFSLGPMESVRKSLAGKIASIRAKK